MARVLIAVALLFSWGAQGMEPQSPPTLSLDVDGERHGMFVQLLRGGGNSTSVTLEEGWISAELLALWWPDLDTGEWLSPGRHDSPADCTGRRVEVNQGMSPQNRGRVRSWVLMDACPSAWEVEFVEGARISVKRLVIRTSSVAVVR